MQDNEISNDRDNRKTETLLHEQYAYNQEKLIIYQVHTIMLAILLNYFKMLKRQIYLKQYFQICRHSVKILNG